MRTKRPFKIKFVSPSEIRMGSPYNYCSIQIDGQTNIKLEDDWWQDKCAWTYDNKYLVLILWNLSNNDPGFHFVVYNTDTGNNYKSERIMGMTNKLSVKDNTIFYNKFLYTGKTADGQLTGNSDNEYEFSDF
jgi:hypothetical protein